MNINQLLPNVITSNISTSNTSPGTAIAIKDRTKATQIINTGRPAFDRVIEIPFMGAHATRVGTTEKLELALSMTLEHLSNPLAPQTLIIVDINEHCDSTELLIKQIKILVTKVLTTNSCVAFTTRTGHQQPVWAHILATITNAKQVR